MTDKTTEPRTGFWDCDCGRECCHKEGPERLPNCRAEWVDFSTMERLTVTAADAERAWDEWGCNCGPAAIAAVLGKSLDDVRPHMGDFEAKRYTNPTLMWSALRSLGVPFSFRGGDLGRENWPTYGLARIQWEGPWTKPGVPARARYRHTHWVGANSRNPSNVGIFDVNALGNGSGWCDVMDWVGEIVPWILKQCEPKADGRWHITHAVEMRL